jgi:hypothetical protein
VPVIVQGAGFASISDRAPEKATPTEAIARARCSSIVTSQAGDRARRQLGRPWVGSAVKVLQPVSLKRWDFLSANATVL